MKIKKFPFEPPVPPGTVAAPANQKKHKGSRDVTIIFYTAYILVILGFLSGLYFLNSWISEGLTEFENSHIQIRSKEIFDQLFAQPDWENIYHLAGIEDTKFETGSAYVSYMEETVGTQALTFRETAPTDGSDYAYTIVLGEKALGHFTVSDVREKDAQWPDWQLSSLTMDISREITVQIQKLDCHTVTINGIRLDDSYTIRKNSNIASLYLPAGTDGIGTELQMVSGLLYPPEIEILDESGTPCPMEYDPETGIFMEQIPPVSGLTPDEETLALDTAKAYAMYKLRNASRGNASLYFHPNSQAYQDLILGDYWFEKAGGYRLKGPEITISRRFSNDSFFVQTTMTATLTATKETKETQAAFYFRKFNGSWSCYAISLGNALDPITSVRLDFAADGRVIHSSFVEVSAQRFLCPVVTAPEGHIFAGWNMEGTDLLLLTEDTGCIALPENFVLKPMRLNAIYESMEGENPS